MSGIKGCRVMVGAALLFLCLALQVHALPILPAAPGILGIRVGDKVLFATAEAIETQYVYKFGEKVVLSVQKTRCSNDAEQGIVSCEQIKDGKPHSNATIILNAEGNVVDLSVQDAVTGRIQRSKFKYNEQQRMVEAEFFSHSGEISWFIAMTYTGQDDELRQCLVYNGDGKKFVRYEDQLDVKGNTVLSKTYDMAGHLISTTGTINEYDEKGNLVRIETRAPKDHTIEVMQHDDQHYVVTYEKYEVLHKFDMVQEQLVGSTTITYTF